MTERADVVGNERAKLTAGYPNNLAVALFVVGGLTPLGVSLQASAVPTLPLLIASVVFIAGSAALYRVALHVLRKLVP